MKTEHIHTYIKVILLSFIFLACSTEKNTLVNRSYHNLTAYYNIYFNGNESLEEGLNKIETRIEEDYTKILPIFKESLPETESLVMGDMERAIDKATKLIKMRSITAPPESNRRQQDPRKRKPVKPEYNRHVPDAYIMMGRAYLYQKNYFLASNTFSMIIRRYNTFPIKYDAYIWLLRTYNESERFAEARELIDMLEADDDFPSKLDGELAIAAADMYLKQLRYTEAIQYLNIGARKIKGNQRKTRYNFILGQLYQEQGNSERAIEAYKRVIRRRPDYEMLFNARINSARAYSGEGDITALRRELNRMSRKRRNAPYLDQIYYALGNILYNEGRINDAVDHYKLSATSSVKNTYQRALSCITLAEIYFDQRDYIPSGMYYDSAMVLIDNNYPNFNAINQKHTSLSRLVDNLLTVETQDSLQHLASLSQPELEAKINSWITAEKQRFDEMDAASAAADYGSAFGRTMGSRMRPGAQGGGWYFYNPSTIAYGKQEFGRLWGERPNDDNWRRSNKSEAMFDDMDEYAEDEFDELIEEEIEPRADDPTTREFYMQDIPTNDSLMAISHTQIREALFDAAMLFKTDFNDFEKAIETYLELNRRYPENRYELPSFFYLWDLYGTIEKPDSAAYYKTAVLNKYPESNYAKYLTNPNFFIEEQARKDSLNSIYNTAFNYYKMRDFENARRYSRQLIDMNADSTIIPKARFIEMVSVSRKFEQSRFADSLKTYIKTYPREEPTKLAQQILDLIEEEKLDDYQELINTGYLSDVIRNIEIIAQSQNPDDPYASKWDADENLLHYFIIAFPNTTDIDINRLRFDIANYNIDHYTTLDFDIETEALNSETRLVVVRNFTNKEAALIYFLSVIRKPEVFKTLAGHQFLNFVVSSSNYREMMNDRAYEQYLSFFVNNYSIYTTGEFPEEDLDSPEELMARLARDPDEELIERGEFVVVDTRSEEYEAPEPEEQIFNLDYDSQHMYMLMIKEARFNTGFVMRDFVRHNSSNFRNQRFRVVPNNMQGNTLLLVSNFENAHDAMQYLNHISRQNQLFSSIGDVQFEHYVISSENLSSLTTTNNIDEWERFYRFNYIQRRPPAPVSEEEPQTQESVIPVEEETQQTSTEQTIEEATEDSQSIPEESNLTQEPEPASLNEQTSEEDAPVETVVEAQVTEEYNGSFEYNAEASHKLVYILPASGSNQALLTTYINRLNATRFSGKNIEVGTEDFDDYRVLVTVSGIGNEENAKKYMDEINADSRITMSLRNVNYRSFIISDENHSIFKDTKNIQDYQKFYNSYY